MARKIQRYWTFCPTSQCAKDWYSPFNTAPGAQHFWQRRHDFPCMSKFDFLFLYITIVHKRWERLCELATAWQGSCYAKETIFSALYGVSCFLGIFSENMAKEGVTVCFFRELVCIHGSLSQWIFLLGGERGDSRTTDLLGYSTHDRTYGRRTTRLQTKIHDRSNTILSGTFTCIDGTWQIRYHIIMRRLHVSWSSMVIQKEAMSQLG